MVSFYPEIFGVELTVSIEALPRPGEADQTSFGAPMGSASSNGGK